MTGTVHIVGAGSGAAELITVRGQRLLETCGAVVYDDLIDHALLALAPAEAECIPVGKRAGAPSARQEDINALLITKAREGKTVVRLKGGDPFVFGRGGEEALALRAAGIPYTVTPGISSALYIPMEAGIPVTHRAVSRSVHLVTAHTAEKDLPEQIQELAQLDGTLVFLMGLHAVERLSAELVRVGKSPETPAAVLSGGNSPQHASVRGTLADIAARVSEAGVHPPAVFVVGPAAAMDVRSPAAPAVTVGLTGTDAFQEKLRRLLCGEGIRLVPIQRGRCVPTGTAVPWEMLRDKWLVFTSGNGVTQFFGRMRDDKIDIRSLHNSKFAVIGRATGEALAARGICADLCPAEYTGEALAEALAAAMEPGEEAVLLDSAKGSGVIPARLGDRCSRVSLYDTGYETISREKTDYLLLGSAGAVNALADSGYEPAAGTVPVCIGPVCAAAWKERYSSEPLMPAEITAEALAALVTPPGTQ